MEPKRQARRTILWKISRRQLLLRVAVLVGLIVAAFAAVMVFKAPFGVGPGYVPSILPVSLKKGWVSSEFGMRTHPITGARKMHRGIDLAVDKGVPVKAAAHGKVVFAGDAGDYGKLVKIDHGNGIETRYAHNSVLRVKAGDFVRRGQVISLAGDTGRVTGEHLHYEVRVNGKAVNPRKYLPRRFVEGGKPEQRETE